MTCMHLISCSQNPMEIAENEYGCCTAISRLPYHLGWAAYYIQSIGICWKELRKRPGAWLGWFNKPVLRHGMIVSGHSLFLTVRSVILGEHEEINSRSPWNRNSLYLPPLSCDSVVCCKETGFETLHPFLAPPPLAYKQAISSTPVLGMLVVLCFYGPINCVGCRCG